MSSDQIAGIVRTIAASVGGFFVAKGLVDSETVLAVSGALATLAVAAWSVWSKRKGV
jgi:ABC-type proline/glycine betaine transport system permease subunit